MRGQATCSRASRVSRVLIRKHLVFGNQQHNSTDQAETYEKKVHAGAKLLVGELPGARGDVCVRGPSWLPPLQLASFVTNAYFGGHGIAQGLCLHPREQSCHRQYTLGPLPNSRNVKQEDTDVVLGAHKASEIES